MEEVIFAAALITVGTALTLFLLRGSVKRPQRLRGKVLNSERLTEYLYRVRLEIEKGKVDEILVYSAKMLREGAAILAERREQEIWKVKRISG